MIHFARVVLSRNMADTSVMLAVIRDYGVLGVLALLAGGLLYVVFWRGVKFTAKEVTFEIPRKK